MLLVAEWQSRESKRQREWRFETPLGPAWASLREDGRRGSLHAFVDASRGAPYTQPGKYAALGALAFWKGPEIRGTAPRLRLTAVPPEWLSVSGRVVTLLSGVGLSAQITDRSLEIRGEHLSPTHLLKRAGLALFSLDPFSKAHVTPQVLSELRSATSKTFADVGHELFELFDDERSLRAFLSPQKPKARHVQESRNVLSDEAAPEIVTRTGRRIQVSNEQWASTHDTFSRRTIDPKWLMYLPPGMCSLQTDSPTDPMEHPHSALDYYRNEGISKVVVELKHMGSRAIIVVCRDEATAERRFGVAGLGCVYTRNGRPFFDESNEFLISIRDGLTRARFWENIGTDWACIDGECLPWTLKSEKLIEQTHQQALISGQALLKEMNAAKPNLPPEEDSRLQQRWECFSRYRRLLERYMDEEGTPTRFAPFQLIATEGRAYFDRTHLWQMEMLRAIARKAGDPFAETPYRSFSLSDNKAVDGCMDWWDALSDAAAEGLVVKPLYCVPQGRRGLAQPAIKCRTEEHLRLVYGPEYDLIENRWDLASRDASKRRREKHRRVLKQAALSIEGVERFVRRDPPGEIENCVRALLSLER